MKVTLLLGAFLFVTFNFVIVYGLRTTRSVVAPSLRVQISGVCTKSVIDKKSRTQKVFKTIKQKCPFSKDKTCFIDKKISYVLSRPVTKLVITKVCCPGYRKSGDKCDPKCDIPCDNGICTQPNFCTCYNRYRKISAYHCAPICDDCHHGICVYPNVCKCFANYERNANGTCVPICKDKCINSECTSPDTCSCHEGYSISKLYRNICLPICNLPCGKGGVCHEPDVCLCARNYRLNETNQCEPVCNMCENGDCIDPGVCVCNENYRLVQNMRNETRCESILTTTIEPTDDDFFTPDIGYGESNSDYDDNTGDVTTLSMDNDKLETDIEYDETSADYEDVTMPRVTSEPSDDIINNNDFISTIDMEYDSIPDDYDEVPNAILEYFTTRQYISNIIPTESQPPVKSYDSALITTTRNMMYRTTPQMIYINETNDNECDTECVNGECADGHCLCNEGYYDSELIPNHCDPICEFYSADGCVNGTCVAPNKCKCYDDFVPISEHICIQDLSNTHLVVDHNSFVKPDAGIKNITRSFVNYFIGTLIVLVLITVIAFFIYKWNNRRLSYHIHSMENVHFGAQYMAEDDGCEL